MMITIDLRKVLLVLLVIWAIITATQYRDVLRYLRMRNM
jgi:hypothetical protein